MNPCFFTALSPLHMFALSACLVIAVPVATLSLAFKLLPGRLPAGTPKFEFQRTVPTIAQVNRGRNAHDARIHLHPSLRLWMEYSFADLDKKALRCLLPSGDGFRR